MLKHSSMIHRSRYDVSTSSDFGIVSVESIICLNGKVVSVGTLELI